MKDETHLVVLEGDQLWVDGVKKRRPDQKLLKAMRGRRKAFVTFMADGCYKVLDIQV